jgi:hypothetical protein
MNDAEKLKAARDVLLRLHKSLVDFERTSYETFSGPVNSGEFLNLLLNDARFAWLRRFSTLIVDVDEMFDQKDGYTSETVELHLRKMAELIDLSKQEQFFREKYELALQGDADAAGSHAALKKILE